MKHRGINLSTCALVGQMGISLSLTYMKLIQVEIQLVEICEICKLNLALRDQVVAYIESRKINSMETELEVHLSCLEV